MRKAKAWSLVALALAAACGSCWNSGKDRPRLGVAMRSFDDARSAVLRKAIETEALDKAELALMDGQGQQAAQDLQVGALFERKLSALAVDPVDGRSVGALIAKAKELRIPVVFFDRIPSDEAMRSWDKLYFVGSRVADAGGAQGEILAELWKAEPALDRNKDKTLQYAWIAAGAEASGPSQAAFAKALAAAGVKVQLMAEGDSAAPIVAKLGGGLEALVCGDAASTVGTIAALNPPGKPRPKEGFPVVGFGADDPAVADALASGVLAGAVSEDAASEGKAVFALAFALARKMAPSWTGWRVTDAKYVWVPYKKIKSAAQRR